MKRINFKRLSAFVLLTLAIAAGGVLADSPPIGQSLLSPVVNVAACTTIVNAGQSIQAALNSVQSGAVVCVRSGVYKEHVTLDYRKPGITLQAYPGERPILDGQGTLPVKPYQGLIQVNASGSIVDGFEVRNSAARGIVVAQYALDTNAIRNVIIRNTNVHDSWDMGIVVNGSEAIDAQNILIENNVVFANLRVNLVNHIGGSGLLFIETANSVARGNVVYYNRGEGLVGGRWTTNLTFEDNITYDNKHSNIYLSASINPRLQRNLIFCTDSRDYWRGIHMKPAPGITLRDETFPNQTVKPPPSRGQVIINNIVVGCGNNFWVATQIAGGGLNDAIVANNSFINARGDAGSAANNVLIEGDVSLQNSKFVNNLILQTNTSAASAHLLASLGAPDMSSFTLADNLYSVAPTKNWPSGESGRIIGDPKLVNPVMPVSGSMPDVNGYKLQSASPAVNAGIGVGQVTEDFFKHARSGALDIGADELGENSGPTTGRIIIAVTTTPARSSQTFGFTTSYAPGNFQLTDGGSNESGQLAAGTYSVSMTPVAGWLTNASCSDGSQPGSIALAAGETVTCTFQSELESEPVTRITVIKQVIPPNDPTSFAFTSNFAGDFSLSSNGQRSADLNPGSYNVSETVPAGWIQDSATCTGGESPGAIDLNQGESITCTFVNRKVITGGGDLKAIAYLTTAATGSIGGIDFGKGDILAYDGPNDSWSLFFDGSDVGITQAIADMTILENGSPTPKILMVLGGKANLSGPAGAFSATPQDIIQFTPTSLGAATAGAWELYFDGSDVTLTTTAEKIDSLTMRGNTLLISTVGKASVISDGVTIIAADEDLIAFTPTSTGSTTSGTWSREFDGSKLSGFGAEDLTSVWHDSGTGTRYVTLVDNFTIAGVSGTNRTVLAIPSSGVPSVFWDASTSGFPGPLDGLHLVLMP